MTDNKIPKDLNQNSLLDKKRNSIFAADSAHTPDPLHNFAPPAQLFSLGSYETSEVQRKPNKDNDKGSYLPDGEGLGGQLKSGLETISGFSMDDVRVHRNSSKPSELNAHAFAQGSDIFLGPGQEQHLPHEAWHVVQQKQGRVNATKQLKDQVSINDDEQLEKEATEMGNKAFQLESSPSKTSSLNESKPSQSVAQREIIWKDQNHPNNAFDAFVAKLDEFVQAGAALSLTPASLTDIDGYTTLWKDTAALLMTGSSQHGETAEDTEEQVAARQFAAARYGYSVESYACQEDHKSTLKSLLPHGYDFLLQKGRGMTRPDVIVVKLNDPDDYSQGHTDAGWFDITSSASVGHIDLKTGAGWSDKPYVAEITYDPLNTDDLGHAEDSIGNRVARRNSLDRRKETWAAVKQECYNYIIARLTELLSGEQPYSWAVKEATIRGVTAEYLGFPAITPIAAKSLLRAIGIDPAYYFRTPTGGSKAEGEMYLRETTGS